MNYCKLYVSGRCLAPFIKDGDVLEVSNWDGFDPTIIAHGDVLVYNVARLWLKFVVAIPGDYFEFIDGSVFVNNKEILTPQNKSYQIQTKVLEGYSNTFIIDGGCLTLSARDTGSAGDSSRMGPINFSNVRGLWRPGVDKKI